MATRLMTMQEILQEDPASLVETAQQRGPQGSPQRKGMTQLSLEEITGEDPSQAQTVYDFIDQIPEDKPETTRQKQEAKALLEGNNIQKLLTLDGFQALLQGTSAAAQELADMGTGLVSFATMGKIKKRAPIMDILQEGGYLLQATEMDRAARYIGQTAAIIGATRGSGLLTGIGRSALKMLPRALAEATGGAAATLGLMKAQADEQGVSLSETDWGSNLLSMAGPLAASIPAGIASKVLISRLSQKILKKPLTDAMAELANEVGASFPFAAQRVLSGEDVSPASAYGQEFTGFVLGSVAAWLFPGRLVALSRRSHLKGLEIAAKVVEEGDIGSSRPRTGSESTAMPEKHQHAARRRFESLSVPYEGRGKRVEVSAEQLARDADVSLEDAQEAMREPIDPKEIWELKSQQMRLTVAAQLSEEHSFETLYRLGGMEESKVQRKLWERRRDQIGEGSLDELFVTEEVVQRTKSLDPESYAAALDFLEGDGKVTEAVMARRLDEAPAQEPAVSGDREAVPAGKLATVQPGGEIPGTAEPISAPVKSKPKKAPSVTKKAKKVAQPAVAKETKQSVSRETPVAPEVPSPLSPLREKVSVAQKAVKAAEAEFAARPNPESRLLLDGAKKRLSAATLALTDAETAFNVARRGKRSPKKAKKAKKAASEGPQELLTRRTSRSTAEALYGEVQAAIKEATDADLKVSLENKALNLRKRYPDLLGKRAQKKGGGVSKEPTVTARQKKEAGPQPTTEALAEIAGDATPASIAGEITARQIRLNALREAGDVDGVFKEKHEIALLRKKAGALAKLAKRERNPLELTPDEQKTFEAKRAADKATSEGFKKKARKEKAAKEPTVATVKMAKEPGSGSVVGWDVTVNGKTARVFRDPDTGWWYHDQEFGFGIQDHTKNVAGFKKAEAVASARKKLLAGETPGTGYKKKKKAKKPTVAKRKKTEAKAEAKAEPAPQPSAANTKKSKGHMLFRDNWEYFVKDGEVHRVKVYDEAGDVWENGQRMGSRWEGSVAHFERLKETGVYPYGQTAMDLSQPRTIKADAGYTSGRFGFKGQRLKMSEVATVESDLVGVEFFLTEKGKKLTADELLTHNAANDPVVQYRFMKEWAKKHADYLGRPGSDLDRTRTLLRSDAVVDRNGRLMALNLGETRGKTLKGVAIWKREAAKKTKVKAKAKAKDVQSADPEIQADIDARQSKKPLGLVDDLGGKGTLGITALALGTAAGFALTDNDEVAGVAAVAAMLPAFGRKGFLRPVGKGGSAGKPRPKRSAAAELSEWQRRINESNAPARPMPQSSTAAEAQAAFKGMSKTQREAEQKLLNQFTVLRATDGVEVQLPLDFITTMPDLLDPGEMTILLANNRRVKVRDIQKLKHEIFNTVGDTLANHRGPYGRLMERKIQRAAAEWVKATRVDIEDLKAVSPRRQFHRALSGKERQSLNFSYEALWNRAKRAPMKRQQIRQLLALKLARTEAQRSSAKTAYRQLKSDMDYAKTFEIPKPRNVKVEAIFLMHAQREFGMSPSQVQGLVPWKVSSEATTLSKKLGDHVERVMSESFDEMRKMGVIAEGYQASPFPMRWDKSTHEPDISDTLKRRRDGATAEELGVFAMAKMPFLQLEEMLLKNKRKVDLAERLQIYASEDMAFNMGISEGHAFELMRGSNIKRSNWTVTMEQGAHSKFDFYEGHKNIRTQIGHNLDPAEMLNAFSQGYRRRAAYIREFGPKGQQARKIVEKAVADGQDPDDFVRLSNLALGNHAQVHTGEANWFANEMSGAVTVSMLGFSAPAQITSWFRILEHTMATLGSGSFSRDMGRWRKLSAAMYHDLWASHYATIHQSEILAKVPGVLAANDALSRGLPLGEATPKYIRDIWKKFIPTAEGGASEWARMTAETGAQIQQETMQALQSMGGIMPQVGYYFLKATGTSMVDRFGRNLAAIHGRSYMRILLEEMEQASKRGDKKWQKFSADRLAEIFGRDPKMMRAALNGEWLRRPGTELGAAERKFLEVSGGGLIGDRSHGRQLAIDMPANFEHPWMKHFYKIQTFVIRMTADTKRLLDFKDPASPLRTKAGQLRLVAALAAGGAGSSQIMELRRRIMNREEFDQSFVESAMELVSFHGIAPMIFDMYFGLVKRAFGPPQEQMIGPVFEMMMEMANATLSAGYKSMESIQNGGGLVMDPVWRLLMRNLPNTPYPGAIVATMDALGYDKDGIPTWLQRAAMTSKQRAYERFPVRRGGSGRPKAKFY